MIFILIAKKLFSFHYSHTNQNVRSHTSWLIFRWIYSLAIIWKQRFMNSDEQKKSHVFNVMPMQMFQLLAIIIQSNLRPMSDKCGTNWIFKMTTDSYSDRQSKLHEFQFTKWTIKHQQFPKLRFLTLWYVTTETNVQLVFRSTFAVCAVHTFGLLIIFDRAGWFFCMQSVIVQWQ